jgi:hypothetical protein
MAVRRQMSVNHGSVAGCIYLLQFNLGNFCRKSVKQATAPCVHSPLLKTPLRFNDESIMF